MTVNFPSSPILYQIFNTDDNSFIWNGKQWVGYSTSLTVNYNASSVVIQDDNSIVGATTSINFGSNLDVSFDAGVATIDATGGGGGESYWTQSATGIHTLSRVAIGTDTANENLTVDGDARVTGILTVGTASITLNGITDIINVGSGVTIDGSTGIIEASSIVIGGNTFTGAAVTSITAGSGISVDQSTGNVTISATGGGGSTIVTISDTAPESPSEGNLWYNSTISRGFIYYVDEDSSQWVDFSPSGGGSVGGGGESYWTETSVGIHTLSNVGIGTDTATETLTVDGDARVTGIVSATSFYGTLNAEQLTGTLPAIDGSALIGVVGSGSGVIIEEDGTPVGTAGTINFGSNLDVSFAGGTATVSGNGLATYANVAGIATYATNAGVSTTSGTATYATTAGVSTTSGTATYATTAGVSTTSGTAGYATTAGISSAVSGTININTTGIITASSFSGSGVNLTNLPAGQLTGTLPAIDGSALIGVVGSGSGVIIEEDGTPVGTAGTINFGSNLDVSFAGGTATVSVIREFFDSGTSALYTFKNVGIGTTNPLQPLHVEGNFLLSADATTTTHITQKAYTINNGTLSWEGSSGQLFSITNNLTSGSIFSVNDVSGIPSIDVDADGTIQLGPYGGNVGIGTTNPTEELTVFGDARVTGILTVGTSSITLDGTTNTINVGSGVTIDGSTGIIEASSIVIGGIAFTGSGGGEIGISTDSERLLGKNSSFYLNYDNFINIPQEDWSKANLGIVESGTTVSVATTYNDLTVRGSLYYPTSTNIGPDVDVIVLYHPSIDSPGVTPSSSALNFLNVVTNTSQINIRDKIIFSVAYPQDAIPAWLQNNSLIGNEFPELLGNYGGSYANFLFGDNIEYAEAALLWVKNDLNTYLSGIGVSKTIDKIFTFGHSQGAYLAHILNTMHQVDGVISNAPGPIDLLTRCSIEESQGDNNISCLKIKTSLGSTSASPESYTGVSLSNFLSGTLSPALFTQALDDDTPQVANMQTIAQPGLESCVNCAPVEFKYYTTGGHPAFVTNSQLQEDIREFFDSGTSALHTFKNVGIGTTNPTSALTVKGNTSLETLSVSGVSTFSDTITGTITTAIRAQTIDIEANTLDDNVYYIPFEAGIGATSLYIDTALFYNPGQNRLTITDLHCSNINASGIITASSFVGDTSNATDGRWTLGASGSSDYTFTGIGFISTTNDPILYLARGRVYEFVNNSGGSHPFEIRVSNGGTAYNDGVTNNGTATGVIRFEVPFNAPNTLYYQCTVHSGMGNTINIYPSI